MSTRARRGSPLGRASAVSGTAATYRTHLCHSCCVNTPWRRARPRADSRTLPGAAVRLGGAHQDRRRPGAAAGHVPARLALSRLRGLGSADRRPLPRAGSRRAPSHERDVVARGTAAPDLDGRLHVEPVPAPQPPLRASVGLRLLPPTGGRGYGLGRRPVYGSVATVAGSTPPPPGQTQRPQFTAPLLAVLRVRRLALEPRPAFGRPTRATGRASPSASTRHTRRSSPPIANTAPARSRRGAPLTTARRHPPRRLRRPRLARELVHEVGRKHALRRMLEEWAWRCREGATRNPHPTGRRQRRRPHGRRAPSGSLRSSRRDADDPDPAHAEHCNVDALSRQVGRRPDRLAREDTPLDDDDLPRISAWYTKLVRTAGRHRVAPARRLTRRARVKPNRPH